MHVDVCERATGSVLIVGGDAQLVGIFTGRDAIRVLSGANNGAASPLAEVMTRDPVSIAPTNCAVDALRAMSSGGFRHVPVTENGKVLGVVSRGDFKGMELEAFQRQSTGGRVAPWRLSGSVADDLKSAPVVSR